MLVWLSIPEGSTTDWTFTIVGLVLLLLAGDSLVKGAVNMSLRLGVPAFIVSLTIVAFGTSAPELLISIKAILGGVPDLALGNVVGSNTANVLLVLGVPALLAVMHTSGCDTRNSYLQMLGATVLFIGLAYRGVFDWIAGLILLTALAGMLIYAGRCAKRHRRACKRVEDDDFGDLEGADPDLPWSKIILYLVLGMIGLPLGASLLVDGASEIALSYGVSQAVIGLTLVAIGTSLPELATTVVAALRNQADVALGNVIGSNMFNLLGIIGVASLVGPIPVGANFFAFDFWVMLSATLILIPFVFFKRDLTRIWGVILSALYITYMLVVL
ncbi:putative sodium/calcium exchanger [Octadecabacter antarcticus 307]|uniref:Putative sodium/calcium exchanger n=1 Tax=Octadecabacter antarcticus 307 TaxID=391626 RepID=M9QZY9_9RHOB|nr:calcium/sodium antiporter [Octadecabacter antarcticus]AGI65919.1 putative sodium/calcium exchanger [Octadecabacter antarcticus 307]